MGVLLKDIPDAVLTPDEVEALANEEFDYADREAVSIREATRKIRQDLDDKIRRTNLIEINRIFGTDHELPPSNFSFGDLMEGPGSFTLKEKAIEAAKALQRGAGAVLKIPGIALKAIGEGELTRKEIEELRQSPDPAKQQKARFYASPAGKRQKAANDMLRRAGNAWIEKINSMSLQESSEARIAREQSFWSNPFYRTGIAVGESAPSYGLAVAATLTSGNPNLGLYIIGTTSATASYENLRQGGIDPDLALMGAVVTGSIEMLTEKIPMDMLMKSGTRPFLVRALRLGTAESFQELFAQLGQNYVDAVVKDIDPENYATALQAARQEWGVITQGWEDAMAAGFVMGGTAAAFAPIPDLGRTQQEMRESYGFTPRNDGEFLAMVEKIREQVRDVQNPFEGTLESAQAAGDTNQQRVTATLEELQAEFDAQKKLADGIPLNLAEREQFPGIAQQEDQIANLRAGQPAAIEQATADAVAEATTPDITTVPLTKTQQHNADALLKHPEADIVSGTNRVRMANDKGVIFQIPAGQIDKKLGQGWALAPKDVVAEPLVVKPSIAEQRRAEVERRLRAGEEVAPDVRAEFADLVAEIEAQPPTEAKPTELPVVKPIKLPPTKKKLLDALTSEEQTELKTLEKQFRSKIKGQLNVGLDPETFILATRIGGFYVKAGFKTFNEWATQVRARVGDIGDHTLRTIYSALREEFPGLETDVEIEATKEIGEGEIRARGTSVSVLSDAIEKELIEENRAEEDDIPTYRVMNMKEQADKAAAVIESDLDRAKRIAFYQEQSPFDLFPENVFTGLRIYARDRLDVDLMMDLALREDVVREHTIMGKRIKSLDSDQDYADPVRAIREVVEARKEQMVRQGKDISALETKLRDLQAELDRTKKALGTHVKTAKREYGRRNTIVSRTEYDSIIARRKKESAGLKHGRSLGAAYIPNAQDFADIAKIATFHLEALGRDFAKWSFEMTRDFGDWINPHLQTEYTKALEQAKDAGVKIPEAKRLTTKKKRLATTTKKLEARLSEQDLAKIPRIPIELDEEGQRLQNAYDLAREKMKAAQAVASIITEEEVRIIAQLAKDAADRKTIMEESERRTEGNGATPTELQYGIAMSMFLEYVNDLKVEANKRTMKQVIKDYLANPVDFVSDFAGTLKATKASLDNSFHLRQGLPTFLKAITGHLPSVKIWWKTFTKSWKLMWATLRKKKVMRGLFAEMVSDPDYKLLKKSGVALNVIEEEIPVDIPSRIPLLGMLFRMGENAFVGSARYMRYQLAKQYLNVWRKSGKELNKKELESIGRLANSQTGRGDIAAKSQRPGLLNNLFWSPRNLRAYIDILTLHAFDRNFSAFARYQAAKNLIRYISGAAMILTLAKWIDDDSVTWDANSADFGKIKVGPTRFSVGGGMTVLVVLVSRLVTRKFTSSTTGKTKSIDTRKFGALGGKELLWNFTENKLSPAAQLALSLIDQKTWDGDKLIIPQMIDDALTPLIIQNVIETGTADDSANVLAALIAEALGVNVQTYQGKTNQKTKARSRI